MAYVATKVLGLEARKLHVVFNHSLTTLGIVDEGGYILLQTSASIILNLARGGGSLSLFM